MKLNIFSLLALMLAGPALGQAPTTVPPAPQAAPEAPQDAPDFDVMNLRAAAVPMAAAPLDMAQTSDPIWVRGDRPAQNRIAAITLRPVEAAVVEQDIGQGPGRTIVLSLAVTGAPGALVSRGNLAAFGGDRFYCGPGAGARFAGRIMCLADRDRDGRFEAGAFGLGETVPDWRQLSMIDKAEPLPAPIRYRAAREDELPAVAADYTNCARDHDQPRYTFALRSEGPPLTLEELLRANPETLRTDPELARRVLDQLARRAPGAAACQPGEPVARGEALHPATLESGAVVARLGELVIAVGPRDEGAAVRLLGLRNPDRLYRITGIAVAPLSQGVTMRQGQLATAQRFNRPVVMLAAEPEVREGPARVGDVIARAEIRHGYMGVLTQDTVIRTLLSRRSLAAGTTLYGIPMSTSRIMTRNGIPMGGSLPGAGGVHLTWCVPVEDDGAWTATCLPQQDGRYTILRGQRPAFEVRSMRYDAGTSTNDGDVPVAEREGGFGQPLRYAFTLRAIAADQLTIAQDTLFGDRVVSSREHRVPRRPGRPISLSFADGALTLSDGPDGTVAVRRTDAFRVGADVMRVVADVAEPPKEEPAPPADPAAR